MYITRIMIVLLISPRNQTGTSGISLQNQINKLPHFVVRLESLNPQVIVFSPENTNNGRMLEDIKEKIGPLADSILRRHLPLMDSLLI